MHLLMTGDLQPRNRRRHTMPRTQVQLFLMSICILTTQMTKGVFGRLLSGPLNRVVYEGATNTTLTCQFSISEQKWTLLPFAFIGNSDEVILATYGGGLNPSLIESFAIDRSQSAGGSYNFTLVVLKATIASSDRANFSTAGVYICEDPDTKFFSQLVVIRTDPMCSSNVTQSTAMLKSGDVIQLSCSIVYGAIRDPIFTYNYVGEDYDYEYGTIDAVMTWRVNGQPIPADNANFTKIFSPTEVTATSTLLISENFDATYMCVTTFSTPSGTLPADGDFAMAQNAPDYFKTCTVSLSGLPITSSPTATTTPLTSTTTARTSSAPVTTTTTTKLPVSPCTPNFFELLLSLILRQSCYDDWICCSPVGIVLQSCRTSCRLLHYSDGKCKPSPSVGCPCIPPGNLKCRCSG